MEYATCHLKNKLALKMNNPHIPCLSSFQFYSEVEYLFYSATLENGRQGDTNYSYLEFLIACNY